MKDEQRRIISAQRGFSLLELLVAVTIFGIALMGISPLFIVAVETGDLTRSSAVATELALGKIEELRALFETQLSTGVAAPSLSLGSHGPEVVTLGSSDQSKETPRTFSVTWDVIDLGGLRRQVLVTVNPAAFSDPKSQAPTRAKSVILTGAFAP